MSKSGILKSTFGPEAVADCPTCGRSVQFLAPGGSVLSIQAARPTENGKAITVGLCGACGEFAIELGVTEYITTRGNVAVQHFRTSELIYPKPRARPKPSAEVPTHIAADYNEAAACESVSKRAAAALGRRCLQTTLHDAGFQKRELNDQLLEAQKHAAFGSELIQLMDALRLVGNYAVHPKADSNGDPLHVEANEVEAIFSTLDELFDVLYVQKARRSKLLAQVATKTGQTLKT